MNFPTVTKHVTLDKMQRFMGPVKNSIHADPEMAKSWGVGGAVAQGGHLVAFLNEYLLGAFGRGFSRHGEISATFVQVVRPGDTLTARHEVTDETPVDGGVRVALDVWLENQNGEKVTVAKATALRESGKT